MTDRRINLDNMQQNDIFLGFEDIFHTFGFKPPGYHTTSDNYPPYNIWKAATADSDSSAYYYVSFALAGIPMPLVKIVHEDRALTISYEAGSEKESADINYIHKGISQKSFRRKFTLSENVNPVDATMKDGILTISLKRDTPVKSAKEIPIKTG